MDTLPYGSSGPKLLPASDKAAPQGHFCSLMSSKKLRKGRGKMRHPKSVPSCSTHGSCTHSILSSTHTSSHVNT